MEAGELGHDDLLHTRIDKRLNAGLHVIHGTHEDGAASLLLRAAAERHHPLDDALLEGGILVQEQGHLDGAPDLADVAAHVLAVMLQHLVLVPDLLGVPETFVASAYLATVRRVRFSPPPPVRMGGCGCCTLGGLYGGWSSW